MKKLLPLIVLLGLGAPTLRANFHLWDIQEVYTNLDGTVQFIEFFSATSGQEFLAAHTLSSTGSSTFTFASDLPLNSPLSGHPNTASSTTNQTFLMATANFTSLYGIVPDYVIPAGFLHSGTGNVLNFQTGTDAVNLTSLPTNGLQSLNADISNASATAFSTNSTATPKNFRGETAVIPEPSAGLLLLGTTLTLTPLWRRRQRRTLR